MKEYWERLLSVSMFNAHKLCTRINDERVLGASAEYINDQVDSRQTRSRHITHILTMRAQGASGVSDQYNSFKWLQTQLTIIQCKRGSVWSVWSVWQFQINCFTWGDSSTQFWYTTLTRFTASKKGGSEITQSKRSQSHGFNPKYSNFNSGSFRPILHESLK